MLNRLTESLKEIFAENKLGEKWLAAPSLRIGNQWIERVVRSGTPAVNVRVKTMRAIAMDLAGPEMARQSLELLPPNAGEIIAERAWMLASAGFTKKEEGYLSKLLLSPGLAAALFRTLSDLRLAGIDPSGIPPSGFEVPLKGREILLFAARWKDVLRSFGFADYAGVLSMALQRLEKRGEDSPGLARDLVLLIPEDADLRLLEKRLLEALESLIPGGIRRLPADPPRPSFAPGDAPASDEALLGRIGEPAAAPPAAHDGTLRIFRAAGEVNEVREVLRRLLAEKIPLDEAELLYTDTDTYIPLVYETFARLADPAPGKEGDDLDTMPVTFAEGVPARYSRPGRALLSLISWIREGYRQETLASMIQDGLLRTPEGEEKETKKAGGTTVEKEDEGWESFSSLARTLRSLPILVGRDRTIAKIEEAIRSLPREPRLEGRRHRLRLLRSLVKDLLAVTPEPGENRKKSFEKILAFLESPVRSLSRFDKLSLQRFTSGIRRFAALAGDGGLLPASAPGGALFAPGALDWIDELARRARVGGSGPRPGKLHAAHLLSGGHSGRPHTFIIGLDDGRFPGSSTEDPLFLDAEREAVSPDLPTAKSRLSRKERDFEILLAGLRGAVTFGFSCRDLAGDREILPGPWVINARRIASGKGKGGMEDPAAPGEPASWSAAEETSGAGRPASFAPGAPEKCLDETETWLQRLLSPPSPLLTGDTLGRFFPWLEDGLRAAAERASDRFTAYDGRIASLDARHDPFADKGPVLSASALEKIGACPRAYFFRYLLKIVPPEETEPDPRQWLDPMKRGIFLHELYHLFLRDMIERGEVSRMAEHEEELDALLNERAGAYRKLYPPPSDLIFEKEKMELQKTARIFLHSEAEHCAKTGSIPFCLEAAAGLRSGDFPSPIDDDGEIFLSLGGGRKIRVRGRIDRIDRVGDAYAVWDYKTGSASKFDKAFSGAAKKCLQGRIIQPGLYLYLARFLLRKKVAPDADVHSFGYVFHGPRERGRRIILDGRDLAGWKETAAALCDVAAKGCFPATDNGTGNLGDCLFCDYKPICGDLERVNAETKRKLGNRNEKGLDPVREVKNHD